MPRFLVTYHGSNMPRDAESMAKARDAFMHWAGKTGPALVDPGAPIAAARTVSSKGTKDGLADGPFNGWSVIEATDLDAAAKVVAIVVDKCYRIRDGLESFDWDRLARDFAYSVSALLDAMKSLLDLGERGAVQHIDIDLKFTVIDLERLVARIAAAEAFTQGLLEVAASCGHA